MSNKEIIQKFKLTASLLELHNANPFKVRAYSGIVFHLEKLDEQLEGKNIEQLLTLEIKKGMAEKMLQIEAKGSFDELDQLLADTPEGVIQMLDIKGIGAKKIRAIWQELNIESLEVLYTACKEGKIAKLKGFGEKTQKLIIEQIDYLAANKGKLHFAKAEPIALSIKEKLEAEKLVEQVALTGEIRRYLEIIDTLEFIIVTKDFGAFRKYLLNEERFNFDEKISGPFSLRGQDKESGLKLIFKLSSPKKFAANLLISSSAPEHLATVISENGHSLRTLANSKIFNSEADIYQKAGMQLVLPEMREGTFEVALAKKQELPKAVEMEDLKGILHNHSTYSDGKHSLEEMSIYCKELGYEYLGITDHSKSAFYANGLDESRISQQHKEIDQLNERLAPFKIFKGIESDILNDGALDYTDDVLASFDFIVASIHSNLKMDIEKATQRLLTAISNPYTTMLGHPTGRLLLRREGYPIDHQAVIDACAKHNVIIEINAHPWRLDLDWRWVRYAIDKGVMISINPDAHEKEGYQDMRFGLLVGRKAGLTSEMTFNALSREAVDQHFNKRKAAIN
ncbi:MAG: DNA polymerase/3'-5' exonuclease PolX [Bacteroidota bacterium]